MRKRLVSILAALAVCIGIVAIPVSASAAVSPNNNVTPTSYNGYKWWNLWYSNKYKNLNVGKAAGWVTGSNNNWWVGNNGVLNHYYMVFQTDCNLVIYRVGHSGAVWASNSVTQFRPCTLQWQGDGNVVIYSRYTTPLWATDTYTYGNNFVMYSYFDDYGCFDILAETRSSTQNVYRNRLGC